jgi:hypothetical protein
MRVSNFAVLEMRGLLDYAMPDNVKSAFSERTKPFGFEADVGSRFSSSLVSSAKVV